MSSLIQKTMEKKLQSAFAPQDLQVINESYQHKGHFQAKGHLFDGAGESHFRIIITAKIFNKMTLIERHREINKVLNEELKDKIHALAIEAKGID